MEDLRSNEWELHGTSELRIVSNPYKGKPRWKIHKKIGEGKTTRKEPCDVVIKILSFDKTKVYSHSGSFKLKTDDFYRVVRKMKCFLENLHS